MKRAKILACKTIVEFEYEVLNFLYARACDDNIINID